ncbi:MAG: acetyl-CoA carboxylase biotin carboxyl carrier protein subunit [Thauera phenolivorans]|uniref:Acetyl-CoA carboxylase biotin carboxyl carrier protein subunit n=1 Tax=Thauera phenolivorans TaxID=1792543 RepID=A0A7X7R8V5_9RHOO|nr:acetyl-CoA carboxylase biotin carboxyl carrier protein subunit [Thauera phenolivorans]NLF55600.1 acetyl-CoA carboxylase biotin carboxyl carrier protein subunit [Thauera phenolivorans]
MKLRIQINDKTFEVDVEVAEADHATLPPAYPVGSAALAGSFAGAPPASGTMTAPPADAAGAAVDEEKVCRSPVSGIVMRLIAQPGQSLQVGDPLMVLEAMKMETNITAPIAGRVAALRVAQGDNVQAGQVVVEFE